MRRGSSLRSELKSNEFEFVLNDEDDDDDDDEEDVEEDEDCNWTLFKNSSFGIDLIDEVSDEPESMMNLKN